MTAGHVRGDATGMLIETHASPRSTGAAWAWITGVSGLVANALLVAFFALARPFQDEANEYSWLGSANDLVIVVQFATFIPVALALWRRMPATRAVLAATAAAVAAMAAVIVLQLLLVTGGLDFDRQVVLVSAAFIGVYAWILTVGSAGHREGTLPRSVTRLGLLLGASYPLGLLIAAPGLLFPWGSTAQYAFLAPGALFASIGWLALPLWPLALARHVFSDSSKESLA